MKLSVILGHPYSESFNAAIAGVVVQSLLDNGHVVRFHDLYREKFDPLLHGAGTGPVITAATLWSSSTSEK